VVKQKKRLWGEKGAISSFFIYKINIYNK
jgi:hypothetical protein